MTSLPRARGANRRGPRAGVCQIGVALVFINAAIGAPLASPDTSGDAIIQPIPRCDRDVTTVHHAIHSDSIAPEGEIRTLAPGSVIVNGDFADGLNGWTPVISGGGTQPGTIIEDNGEALLTENASFLVSLQQTFTIPDDALQLSFDVILDPGFDLGDAYMPDAFEVHLLDTSGASVVPAWHSLATSFFNIQEDQSQNLASGVSVDQIGDAPPSFTVRVDLTGVPPGTEVTLYVDLIGADADMGSGVRVDNFFLARRSDPPVCDAGGPYTTECESGISYVRLDASGSYDHHGEALTYWWTVDCPAANFDDPTSPTPRLRMGALATDGWACEVTLQVDNGLGGVSSCSTMVTVEDTTPPVLICSGEFSLESVSELGVPVANVPVLAAAFDECDENVTITDDRPADVFPFGVTLVTFTATDAAGNEAMCTTEVEVIPIDGSSVPAGQQNVRVFVDERVITTRPVFRLCGIIGPFPLGMCVVAMIGVRHVDWRRAKRRRG